MPIQPEIRLCRAADREAVIDLWLTCFGEPAPHNDYQAAIDRKVRLGDQLFFVAEIENKIVGTAIGGYDGHRGWAYSVAVAPPHRRRGIGAALMQAIENEVRRLGGNKVNLQVRAGNEAVVAFYRSLGYAVEERVSMGKVL